MWPRAVTVRCKCYIERLPGQAEPDCDVPGLAVLYLKHFRRQKLRPLRKRPVLWQILIQFVFRLSLGLAATMALTSPKQVSSGFFRVHLWVLLGLATFGSLAVWSQKSLFAQPDLVTGIAVAVAVLSYIGSVIWLYEQKSAGLATLVAIVLLCTLLLLMVHPSKAASGVAGTSWLLLDIVSGSMLLGSTFAAMLLGHWYLNSPTMKLDPLKWLLIVLAGSLVARALLSGTGFGIHFARGDVNSEFAWAATAMRWLAGVVGLGGMTWMTWQTLKIPNTQSATGILYVALVFVFLGELASAVLAFESPIPL